MADPVTLTVAIVPVILASVGGVVWGVRLEGRVNKNEAVANTKDEDLKELITIQFAGMAQRLARIENALNGYIRHYNDNNS